MKLNELSKLIKIDTDKVEVSAMHELENHFFSKSENYRTKAIEFCKENKINYHSTVNNNYEMMKSMMRIVCPVCGKDMAPGNGSGNDSIYSITFRCCCGEAEVSVTMPHNGISVSFKEGK